MTLKGDKGHIEKTEVILGGELILHVSNASKTVLKKFILFWCDLKNFLVWRVSINRTLVQASFSSHKLICVHQVWGLFQTFSYIRGTVCKGD